MGTDHDFPPICPMDKINIDRVYRLTFISLLFCYGMVCVDTPSLQQCVTVLWLMWISKFYTQACRLCNILETLWRPIELRLRRTCVENSNLLACLRTGCDGRGHTFKDHPPLILSVSGFFSPWMQFRVANQRASYNGQILPGAFSPQPHYIRLNKLHRKVKLGKSVHVFTYLKSEYI